MTINDRSSTTWDTRHPLHVLADGHGEVDVHPISPFTLNWSAHQLNYTTLHRSAASSSSSKPQSLAPSRPLITPHRDDGPTSSLFQPHARPELCHLQDTPVALMPRPGLDG